MEPKEFGEYLKKIRKTKKMTIRQLELYSGVSNAYLSHIENGKRGVPSPEILMKLSKPLGTEYEELMKKAGYINSEQTNEITTEDKNVINEFIHMVQTHSDEEILKMYKHTSKGKELPSETVKELISYARYRLQQDSK